MMLPCTGCKHLWVLGHGHRSRCQEAVVGGMVWRIDPTTGIGYHSNEVELKYGLRIWENTTERCRAADMPCGPERKLYAAKPPNFWQRLCGCK